MFMKKIFSVVITVVLSFLIINCSNSSSNSETDLETEPPVSSQITTYYDSPTNAVVTYCDISPFTTTFIAPEIADGYYQCAVFANRYDKIPVGSAVEIAANGKTIKCLVTDYSPAGSSIGNGFFDLERSAFEYLSDLSVGPLPVIFKTIPYSTDENIKIKSRNNTNEYYLDFIIYNMRYPLKKVELSTDGGVNFYNMNMPEHFNFINLSVASTGGVQFGFGANNLTYFRLTDIYNQVVTASVALTSADADVIYDLGVNFNY